MRFSYTVLVAVLASVTVAQQTPAALIAQIPACSYTCLVTASTAAGCTDQTDYTCQCGTARAVIVQAATPCIAKNCTVPESLATQKVAMEICGQKAAAQVSGDSSSSAAASSAIAETIKSMSASSTSGLKASTTSSAGGTTSATSSKSGSSTEAAAVTSTSSTSTPTPSSASPGSKLEGLGAIAGVALLAAFVI